MSIIAMGKLYNCRPSQMLNIEEEAGEYVAYCFDEACAYIVGMEAEGKKAVYKQGKQIGKKYSSFSEFYKTVTK